MTPRIELQHVSDKGPAFNKPLASASLAYGASAISGLILRNFIMDTINIFGNPLAIER